MKFFVIPPNANKELMDFGSAGHYCLAHLYLKDKEYRNFFLERKEAGSFILLDNGAAESSLVTEKALLKIVKELQPDEVISPDVLFDSKATADALISFVKGMGEIGALGFTKIFFCPQGKTKDEWIASYRFGLVHPLISTIGLSKIAVPKAFNGVRLGEDRLIMESRHEAIEFLEANHLISKPIHMLGAGDPREFRKYRNNPLIRSTDSAFSVVAAINDHEWSKGDFVRIPTPKDYFDCAKLDDDTIRRFVRNISYLKEHNKMN